MFAEIMNKLKKLLKKPFPFGKFVKIHKRGRGFAVPVHRGGGVRTRCENGER